jgi:hypothetical protein
MSRKRKPTATNVPGRQSQHGNGILRRRQSERAMAGDTKMLIWLGKNRLGQTDHGTTVDTLDPLAEREGETLNLAKLPTEDLEKLAEILQRAGAK